MSINPLSKLHELAQAVIAPINNINFHPWTQTTKPGNQIAWKGQLSVQFVDHDVPGKNETVTVEAEGPKKKAVQQELARKILEKISEDFKRPDNYVPAFFRHTEMAPKLPRERLEMQTDAIPYLEILKDPESSKERRGMAEAWLKVHLR